MKNGIGADRRGERSRADDGTQGAAPTIHGLFEQQALRTPNAPAVEFLGASLTYHQLDRRADAVAAQLHAAGASPGDVIAVCMERSDAMVSALLGVLKAGCAYLPVDPAYPAARIRLVLEDAGPSVILTQRSLSADLSVLGLPLIFCNEPGFGADRFGSARAAGDPGSLAYVIYTSGSTGRPKGVEIEHRSVVNLLAAFRRELGFTASDSMLAVTTLSFDISVLELFLPLTSGGRVLIAPREVVLDPAALAELIDSGRCTLAQGTPVLWRSLVEGGWRGRTGLKLLCGGEAMARNLADALLDRCETLWNVYGPTETTVWSTLHRVERDTGPVPAGLPIDNTTLHILTPDGSPLPAGQVGEVCIGGVGVARGYRGRPELTADRFLREQGRSQGRLYRTGDLGRLRSDGILELLGRADDQVKVRGHRIELGEVEAALAAVPSVAWGAVRAWPDATGETALIAYVVARQGFAFDAFHLRAALRLALPGFMTPGRFVEMQALPTTPNGKVDRKALPIPAAPEATNPASDDVEARLAVVWGGILGLADIPHGGNFFDLGGYSLLTVKLLQAVESEFGRRLSLPDVFAAPTLAEMAALLTGPPGAAHGDFIRLQPLGDRAPLVWLDAGPLMRPLAVALAPNQPLFGLHLPPDEEDALGEAPSVPEIAVAMVRTLRRLQPLGPYRIGGWCRWGTVAYEVAQLMQEQGANVELLVLLDTTNHARVVHEGGLLRHASGAIRAALRKTRRPARSESVELTFSQKVECAATAYLPKSYPGRMALLRPKTSLKGRDSASGWRGLAQILTVDDLPGDHLTMLRSPHLAQFAAALLGRLDEASPAGEAQMSNSRDINNQQCGTSPQGHNNSADNSPAECGRGHV